MILNLKSQHTWLNNITPETINILNTRGSWKLGYFYPKLTYTSLLQNTTNHVFTDRSILSHIQTLPIQDTKTTWYTAEINVDSEFHVLFTIHNWCKQIPSACNEFITPIRTNQSMATTWTMGWNGGWRLNKGRSHAEENREEQTTK